MEKLDTRQFNYLLDLSNVEYIDIQNEKDENLEIRRFLSSKKLIRTGYKDLPVGRHQCAWITEEGRAFLATQVSIKKIDRRNLAISIVAVVISIAAFVKSFF